MEELAKGGLVLPNKNIHEAGRSSDTILVSGRTECDVRGIVALARENKNSSREFWWGEKNEKKIRL